MSSAQSADTNVSLAGKSALHWAAAVNNVEATLLLLKNGANRDMQDNKVQSGLQAGGLAQQRPAPEASLSPAAPPAISVDRGGSRLDGSLRKGIGLPQGRAGGASAHAVLSLLQAVLHVTRCSLTASLVFDGPSAVPCSALAHFLSLVCFPAALLLCSWTPGVFLFAFLPLSFRSGFPLWLIFSLPPALVLPRACPFSAFFYFSLFPSSTHALGSPLLPCLFLTRSPTLMSSVLFYDDALPQRHA